MSSFKKLLVNLGIGAAALMMEFIFHQPQWAFGLVALVGGAMTISMLLGMIATLRSGKYGVDILAITAIVATLLVGEYWASLMVLIMLTGGDSLEEYASRHASRELRALLDNSPQIAHRIEGEAIVDLPVDDVAIGDLILVKPGEIVPVDGRVVAGVSAVDESSLTGEARPMEKSRDDFLMSGAINGDSALRFKVTKLAVDSQYQILVKLVKESEEKPAPFVRMADRYAVPFTLAAYLIGGLAWFVSKDPVRFAEVLVVASPCPLILAAPVALVAGMSRFSRNGIIVKTGTTLEKLSKAKTIAFDKTGTLTEGRLSVDQVKSLDPDYSATRLLQLAASAEEESTHILARSLVAHARKEKIELLPIQQLKEVTGAGIEALVGDLPIRVGKASFAGGAEVAALGAASTAAYISLGGKYVGYITFKDIVRPESAATVTALKDLGVTHAMMLTGDCPEIANQIAKQVGIHDVRANCLPEEKIRAIKEIDPTETPVIMVGDGVNDAPALAVADIGIAMGAHGSTAASESADAVILKDDLTRVSEAVRLAQETLTIAKQSVLIGIFICVVLMLVAATGAIPALLGAALQEIIDTVSILSALRASKDR